MARLLFTNCTENAEHGGVYLFDTVTKQHRRVLAHPSRGITQGPDGMYVVGTRGAIYHLDPETWQSTLKTDTKLAGSHDIRWLNGEFVLVASRGNWVVRLDEQFKQIDSMQIVADDGDVCHANCLVEVDGSQLLTIFTLSPGLREEKRHGMAWRTEGKVLRLDWKRHSFDIAYEPLCQPHSMHWRDGQLYLCESFTGAISTVSFDKKKKTELTRMHGFVRGLAFADGKAYVGVSRVRTKRTAWQKFIYTFHMKCGIVEMDPKTWKPTARYKMPGTEVYEVMALD